MGDKIVRESRSFKARVPDAQKISALVSLEGFMGESVVIKHENTRSIQSRPLNSNIPMTSTSTSSTPSLLSTFLGKSVYW